MSEISFETVVRYTQERLGDGGAPALSVIEWIKSAIYRWAHSASITSFAPFDSHMSRDRSFDELLLELLTPLVNEREFDGIGAKPLVCSALVDALGILLDENQEWATARDKNDEADFADASLLSATLLAVFRTLQYFDSERAIRWAGNLLRVDASSIGFLSFGTNPFAITLFSAIERKTAKSEARSGFFVALYEWAEKKTTEPQVMAWLPELLLLRLEAVHGSQIDQQMFDILESVFMSKGIENLQPIQAIDNSIASDVEDFGDDRVLSEYSSKLSETASVHVARYIREMGDTEKRKWLESQTLRAAFWKPLNTPPIPEYSHDSTQPGYEVGSALGVIVGGEVCET